MVPEELLQFKAGLGRWERKDANAVEIYFDDTALDSKPYLVTRHKGSYVLPQRYFVTKHEANDIVAITRKQGYKLVKPQYPELSEFFKNGLPINHLEEALETLETNSKYKDGFEALRALYK